MDELELLKKHWKKDDANYPKVSYDEIYTMTHKKSSSIVKWIFIISIIEFSIGLALTIINPQFENQVEYPLWIEVANYLALPIIAYFIYKFYKNFKKISSSDHVKGLISNILTVRKTVKYYIGFNLLFIALLSPFMILSEAEKINAFNANANFGQNTALIIGVLVVTALIIGICYGIYYLIYGILLKRLNKNFKELEKLDM